MAETTTISAYIRSDDDYPPWCCPVRLRGARAFMPDNSDDRTAVYRGPELSLPDGWTEHEFERGFYGPYDYFGIDADIRSESARIGVFPALFDRDGREEKLTGLSREIHHDQSSDDIEAKPDVKSTSITAVYVDEMDSEYGSRRTEQVTYCRDAGDGLAIACWLATAVASPATADLGEVLNIRQGGIHEDTERDTDDDRLAAAVGDATHCLFSGSPTQSHTISIPYRYGPLFDGFPFSYQDVPAIPEETAGFEAVVSHSAWTDYGLGEATFDMDIERRTPGTYRLYDRVCEVLRDRPLDRVAHQRLG